MTNPPDKFPGERHCSHSEGSVCKTKDGAWRGPISLGYGPDGKPRHKYVSGRIRAGVNRKVTRFLSDDQRGIPIPPFPATRRIPSHPEGRLSLTCCDVPRQSKGSRTAMDRVQSTHRSDSQNRGVTVYDRHGDDGVTVVIYTHSAHSCGLFTLCDDGDDRSLLLFQQVMS